MKRFILWIAASALLCLAGCKSSPASPFDQLEASNVTAYRLQNYELPPQAQAQPVPGQPGQVTIPGLPPEIQGWIQQGAQGLQQLIPPQLSALIPGMAQAAQQAAPPPQPEAPRFHNFRILGSTQVIDPGLKERLAEILGDPDNFHNQHGACGYSEMGLSFGQAMAQPMPAQPGQPAQPQTGTNDILISFSCNQIIAASFMWPHPYSGMKKDTVAELSDVVSKLWPPGT